MKEIAIVIWVWVFNPAPGMESRPRCGAASIPAMIREDKNGRWINFQDSFAKPDPDVVKLVDEASDCFDVSVASNTITLTVVDKPQMTDAEFENLLDEVLEPKKESCGIMFKQRIEFMNAILNDSYQTKWLSEFSEREVLIWRELWNKYCRGKK